MGPFKRNNGSPSMPWLATGGPQVCLSHAHRSGSPRATRCHQSSPGVAAVQLAMQRDPQRKGPGRPVARQKAEQRRRDGVALPKARLIAGQGLLHALMAAHVRQHGLDSKNERVNRRGRTACRRQGAPNGGMGQGTKSMDKIIHAPTRLQGSAPIRKSNESCTTQKTSTTDVWGHMANYAWDMPGTQETLQTGG